jgi:hypothetical protein
MKWLNILSVGLVFALLSTAARGEHVDAAKPYLVVQKQRPMQLKVIGRRDFCARFSNSFSKLASSGGLDASRSLIFGNQASSSIIDQFRQGRASDFINAQALRTIAGNNGMQLPQTTNGYLPLTHFLAGALEIQKPVHLVLSAGELRYVPFGQQRIDIVVIADNAASLTPDRAQKVASVARNLNMTINVVWAGTTPMNQDNSEAQPLAFLSAATGGAFVDLSGAGDPCQAVL